MTQKEKILKFIEENQEQGKLFNAVEITQALGIKKLHFSFKQAEVEGLIEYVPLEKYGGWKIKKNL